MLQRCRNITHKSTNWTHHCHAVSFSSHSLRTRGIAPAARNMHTRRKTSTHHDLIRGCRWMNSCWRCGRWVSSKCAASAKTKNRRRGKKIIIGQVATGCKQRERLKPKRDNWRFTAAIWLALVSLMLTITCSAPHGAHTSLLVTPIMLKTDKSLFVWAPRSKSACVVCNACVIQCHMPWWYSRTTGWRVAWLRCSRPAAWVKSTSEEKGNPWWWHASLHLPRYLLKQRKSSSNLR